MIEDIENAVSIDFGFNEDTGDIEFIINCPEDDLFVSLAFGAPGESFEDIASEVMKVAKEVGLELDILSQKSFVDPKILSEREKIKSILKK